jgi:ell wall binding domain 2 (CWB2)
VTVRLSWRPVDRAPISGGGAAGRRRPAALAALSVAAAIGLSAVGLGCGADDESPIEVRVKEESGAGNVLGFPILATKNTTRVAGEDPAADAAAVASAVFPGLTRRQRPPAVALVEDSDAQAGVAAAVLMAPPLRAPILLTDGRDVPDITSKALEVLRPRGSALVDRAQAFAVGDAGAPEELRTERISGDSPFELTAAIDAFRSRATGRPSSSVVVVPAADPRFAMPAAGWAAKSGDSVLFVRRNTLPAQTRRAIIRHRRPRIYVLGPRAVISETVVRRLRRLGTVTRIAGDDPVENAVAFARFSDGSFGWGARDPGHGLVIANWNRPLDAAAAAPLSSSGTYGPLLLTDSAKRLPSALRRYLLDVQPGYQSDPVRGVYNHAWLMGDESAISLAVQTKIDEITEIVRVTDGAPAP